MKADLGGGLEVRDMEICDCENCSLYKADEYIT